MRHERLVWVANRIAIVSSCAWTLLACSSKGFAPSNPSPASDAGPSPCTVTTAAAPACVLIVEPLQVDGGDAGDEDAGDLDASTASDGDAPDATVLAYDASCPITTTSEIQCGDVSYELNAAANTTGEAYASIVEPLYASSGTYATQLVDLKPDGTGTTSLEPVPRSENMRAVVVSNADGTPGIVGERSQTDLRYYTQSGGGWTAENIPGTAETAFSLNGAASSKSGQVFALLVNDAQHASILTRAASGGWTAGAPIAIAGADTSTLALDVEGVPYVLGVGYDSSGTTSGFWLSTGSAPPVSFSGPSELAEGAMLAIAGAAGAQKDALAFVQNYSESTIDLYDATDRDAQRTLGGLASSTCPSLTIGFTCDDCQVGTQCDTYVDQITAFAAALTDDGRVWIAYVAASVDEVSEVELDNDPIFPVGCICTTSTTSTTAQTAAIVVEPLGAKGADTGISMRMPIPTSDGSSSIAMAASGSTLHVLVTKTGKVSHIAIDTSKVPVRR